MYVMDVMDVMEGCDPAPGDQTDKAIPTRVCTFGLWYLRVS